MASWSCVGCKSQYARCSTLPAFYLFFPSMAHTMRWLKACSCLLVRSGELPPSTITRAIPIRDQQAREQPRYTLKEGATSWRSTFHVTQKCPQQVASQPGGRPTRLDSDPWVAAHHDCALVRRPIPRRGAA